MTQTIRHIFRFLNLFVVVGAFVLIDETRLTQVVMGLGFLFLAGIEAGLFLWDAGSRVRDGDLQRWLVHGSALGDVHHSESGLGSAFILMTWTTLGLALIM